MDDSSTTFPFNAFVRLFQDAENQTLSDSRGHSEGPTESGQYSRSPTPPRVPSDQDPEVSVS